MQVIRRLDTGERQSQIGAALNLATSRIRTILKNKEKILSSATATTTSSATRITRSRNNTIEEMEKRLSIGIDNEMADNLAKETQNSPQLSNRLILTDADAIARRKLTSHPVKKHFIPDLNCNRIVSTTIARLRTRQG
ncbi:hypothetical protein TNCV_1431771 [Trichonephila clavipes]|nr:hypothetical protein TNCV_1431771 [Trichonephila clavipes]